MKVRWLRPEKNNLLTLVTGGCLEPSAEAPAPPQKLGNGAVCLLLIFPNHNAQVLEKDVPLKQWTEGPAGSRTHTSREEKLFTDALK